MTAAAIEAPESAGRGAESGLGLGLALRLARREFRSGLVGFRVFLACLTLGVAAIAGVGSVSESLLEGLRQNGRAILGGDLELRLSNRPAGEAELAYFKQKADLSELVSMRTMARSLAPEGNRVLAELRAVDDKHPLYGALRIGEGEPLDRALEQREGVWGAAVGEALVSRLALALGDRFRIGTLDYELRSVIESEPDRASRGFVLGPTVMVERASLAETGLEQPGSMIRYTYRLRLPPGSDVAAFRAQLGEAFPEAGWRVRAADEAAPGLSRFILRLTTFLTLVGLTTLLVGGVGVGNAVKGYLDGRTATIATLKCLGAPSRLIHQTYLMQIMVLALLGSLLGAALGALAPLPVNALLSGRLGFEGTMGVYPAPLTLAVAFGLLTALAFSLWPLAKARKVPAASLFRDRVAPADGLPTGRGLITVGLVALALAGLAIATAEDHWLATLFVSAATGVLLSFHLIARGLIALAKRAPRSRHAALRLAVANLHRPGAPTASVILSLGLGLTVLVAVAEIEANLASWVEASLPKAAPAFYFIDIQPDQVEDFEAIVTGTEGVEAMRRVPMLRGRITAVNGTPPERLTIPNDIAWVFRGDRGLTWTREPLEGSELTAGEWWPADYDGPPLMSLDAEVGELLGIGPGDRLSVNVLGRDVEVEIANLRRIEWSNLTINFVMVFSPGLLERAPQSHIATVHAAPEAEAGLERAVTDRFANVTPIRVKTAVETFSGLIANVSVAVRATAAVALLAGILVLAGAVAAGQQRRIYDAVVLKVLGATRRMTANAYFLEFLLMALATVVLAAVFGSLSAYFVLTELMDLEFTLIPEAAASTLLGGILLTSLFGFLGTWRALSQKAAPLLRNE